MLSPLLLYKFEKLAFNQVPCIFVKEEKNGTLNFKLRGPKLERNGLAFVPSTTRKLCTSSVLKSELKINQNMINLNTSLPLKKDSDLLISIPVYKVYTHIQEKSTLSMIKEDLKLKSGIYAFVHNETKKLYVGSSFNLAKRLNDHLNN